MIHKYTRVHILDIDQGTSFHYPVKSLATQYIQLRKPISNNSYYIDLSNNNIMIKEYMNWTRLTRIDVVSNDVWYNMQSSDDPTSYQSIKISDDTLIPVYDANEVIRGFHGEVKFHYRLKTPDEVLPGDKVRYMESGSQGNQIFIPINLSKIIDTSYGYILYTQSGFFNAANYHMFSGDRHDSQIGYK